MINSTTLTNFAKSCKVLIIEDDVKLQNKFKRYFNDFFKNSFITSNNDHAIEIFDKYHPEIVIVNIDINETENFNLIKKFKEKNIFSQVIVISDNTQIRILLNCIHTGVTEYLPLPVNFENFERYIMKALNNLYVYKNGKEKIEDRDTLANDKNPFEDIQKLLRDKHTEITLINNYKGIQIKHVSELLDVKEEYLIIKTTATQLYAIKYEGATVLRTEHIEREILSDIEKINYVNNEVYLSNLRYIGLSSQVRKDIRIEPDSGFIVSMYKANGESVDTELVDISMNSLSVKIHESVKIFEEKEKINIKIKLDFSNSITFKNVLQTSILACKATILSIKTIANEKKIILITELSNHDKDILSKYILQREMVLIEEFKEFILNERRNNRKAVK